MSVISIIEMGTVTGQGAVIVLFRREGNVGLASYIYTGQWSRVKDSVVCPTMDSVD